MLNTLKLISAPLTKIVEEDKTKNKLLFSIETFKTLIILQICKHDFLKIYSI